MRSRLLEVIAALDDVYSGWILWNLFLAFIPLVLSFVLFRRRAIAQRWLWSLCAVVGFIGFVSFIPRYGRLIRAAKRLVQDALAGDVGAQLDLAGGVVLGAIATGLGFWLLRQKRPWQPWLQKVLWWLGFATFVAFLPNAPYLLTDIIHLVRGSSSGEVSLWVLVLVFIPMHVAAIVLGFEAYVISLLNQDVYLKQHGAARWILPVELTMHGLSALGIYLGRFIRFNSWDLVADPSNILIVTLNTLTAKRPLAVIIITFVILTLFYWIMKQITLGLKLRIDYARRGVDVLE